MSGRLPRFPLSAQLAAVAAAALLGMLTPRSASAQAAVNVDAGIDGYFKADRWLPVRVNLLNQGAPSKAEVRVRFSNPMDRGDEHRIPERNLPGSANEVHYLYLRSPMGYGGQNLAATVFRDGRQVGAPTRPQIRMVNDGDWLVCAVGDATFAATMKNLNGHTLGRMSTTLRPWMGNGRAAATVNVGAMEPGRVPDRWQGLQAADMVVLGAVSERDFTPDQLTALRDYVSTGGTLVVVGGVNSSRLAAPFFSEILPVTVSGTRTLTGMPTLAKRINRRVPTGKIPVVVSTPKSGALVSVAEGGVPVVVTGRKGAGRVVFLAFDPSLSPFREWDGMREAWSRILASRTSNQMIPAISGTDAGNEAGIYYGQQPQAMLAQAPYSISQLDIPAFYIVALFLLAYIVVLVPVNYFLLKRWDKKEYAWLTTPAIVAVFVVGAYMIGYGFKGSSTLVSKVGVVEAHAGQDTAATLAYAGIFSPAKTSYDLKIPPDDPQGQAQTTLMYEPSVGNQESSGIRVAATDDGSRVEGFDIDMWAMRVIKSEGLVRLGKTGGFDVKFKRAGFRWTGTVTNNTPYTVQDCRFLFGGQVKNAANLAPGQTASFDGTLAGASGSFLPPGLQGTAAASTDQQRIKRAVLQPLSSGMANQVGWSPPGYPLLVGWVKEPIAPLRVNGTSPREQSATLLVLHLDNRTAVGSGLEGG